MRRDLLLVLVFFAASSEVSASETVTHLSLDVGARKTLDLGLVKARSALPQTFAAVKAVVAQADALDHKRRGRFFPMTPMLREGAGKEAGAVFALLEPLLYPERFALPASASAHIALRTGLLEAAGELHDPNAAPAYRALLDASTEPHEVRAAAEALGKLGLDADVALLVRRATTAGPQQDAVLASLGSCRRLAAAQALEHLANGELEPARAKIVAAALGHLASAWALAIPKVAPAAELIPLRRAAAAGALALFVSAPSTELRTDASDALMGIDDPETPALIAAASAKAPPELSTPLAMLRQRFDHNPTRSAR